MTRISKIQAKAALSFCTLFCLSPALALSQQVDTAWVRRYNGPGNGDDKAVAIAVDSSGNVFVTGSSFDSTTGYDYCTIKYLSSGDTSWIRRYNGTGNGDDFPTGLALDPSGNVFVTGQSYGSGTGLDYSTVKYDPQGNLLWVSRYDGSGGGTDIAYAITVDKNGNAYVTGTSGTLKYDPQGKQLWVNVHGGVAVALDSFFNVFVTTGGGATTIKFDSSGDELWAQVLSEENDANTRAIAVNPDGTSAVTGTALVRVSESSWDFEYVIAMYSPQGIHLWATHFPSVFDCFQSGGANAVAMDSRRNVYVTGQLWYCENYFGITLKYDSLGNLIWNQGFFSAINGYAMAVDSAGNVFVHDYGSVLEYEPSGNLIWIGSYAGIKGDLKLDERGNIYATGYAEGNGTGKDFISVKYSFFPKGDLNLDGTLSAADAVLELNCVFFGASSTCRTSSLRPELRWKGNPGGRGDSA